MTRRDFLARMGIAGCIFGAGKQLQAGSVIQGHGTLSVIVSYLLNSNSTQSSPGRIDPEPGELFIPPLLDPAPVNGVKQFRLTIQEGSKRFIGTKTSPTYGINGDYLGPTLYMRNGEDVAVTYINRLNEATTMHGHGMHVPASMDGGPHQRIDPGTSWTARYRVDQKACTNWYHPHLMGKTAEQVYKGLAGMIYIDDNESLNLPLPKRYGIDDLPLVIQDRRFTPQGILDYSPSRRDIMQGYMGDTFLVNGVVQPYFVAEAGLLRLRLLNGSNARVYRFAFSDGRLFSLIAGDNSLLTEPVSISDITLSPGERAEIVVDLSEDYGYETTLIDQISGKNILNLLVRKYSSVSSRVPDKLTDSLYIPDESSATYVRRFVLGMNRMHMTINGKTMDLNRIDEYVPLNRVEIWEVRNTMGINHNFHIHATHFSVLERNGSSTNVQPWERGYKDVVFMPPNSSVKLLVKMKDYKDASSPYMYHCHVLEHEDDGMMGQFVVT